MADLYLCTHYGFGDYVTCYGLVKELAKKHDNVILFARPHRSDLHIDNIKRLYSSIKNVQICLEEPALFNNVLYVGWDSLVKIVKKDSSITCQKAFYDQVGVPLNLMWDNFYFKRDKKREFEVYYGILGLKDNSEFILLHDDPYRDFIIDRKYINPNFRVIHLVELEDVSILDSLYLVEKSKEVHVMNTGLIPFIEQMNIKHSSLNYHKYIRKSTVDQPILKLNWNIIN